jgi:hypothetical protein
MKHFILLLIVGFLAYFAWTAMALPQRSLLLCAVKPHIKPLVAIVLVLLAGLVAAVYLPAFGLI